MLQGHALCTVKEGSEWKRRQDVLAGAGKTSRHIPAPKTGVAKGCP